MSAKDIFHESVKKALQKEQWIITSDPLKFKFGEINFQIDFSAEKIIAAEKGNEKIAIKIKNFLNPSAITDLLQAGVPKEDIVLGFRYPKVRQYTGFAVMP
ncbi:element excision factor XisH family protein [Nostoc sp.]|uniref:element excision factor XisH family protein n=1 Tax=Nostoc sp. TaxID=1180 RepID=UPI002FF56E37